MRTIRSQRGIWVLVGLGAVVAATAAIRAAVAVRALDGIVAAVLLCGALVIVGGLALRYQWAQPRPRRRRGVLPLDHGFPREDLADHPFRH